MSDKAFFNTTVDPDLLKQFKLLAVEQNKRMNALFEEAMRDLLKKYSQSIPEKGKP